MRHEKMKHAMWLVMKSNDMRHEKMKHAM